MNFINTSSDSYTCAWGIFHSTDLEIQGLQTPSHIPLTTTVWKTLATRQSMGLSRTLARLPNADARPKHCWGETKLEHRKSLHAIFRTFHERILLFIRYIRLLHATKHYYLFIFFAWHPSLIGAHNTHTQKGAFFACLKQNPPPKQHRQNGQLHALQR